MPSRSDPAPAAAEPAALPSNSLFRALLRLPHAPGLAASVFFLGFGLSIAAPYLSLYGVNRVGMTPLQLGLFLTLNAVSAVLVSTRLARVSDRMPSRRPLVLLALASGAAGYLALSALHSYLAVVLVGLLLLGLGAAAFPQLFSFARASFGGAAGGLPERALTVLRSMFSLAWVVGPGLGALALVWWGFTGVFLLAAGCLLLAALPLLRVGAPPPPATPVQPAATGVVAGPTPPVHWVVVAFVLYGMSMSMGMSFFPLLITKTLGGGSGQVGFLVALCALLEIPVMLALVTLRRLPGLAWLIKAAMGLFVLHFALVYLAQGQALLVVAQVIRAVVLAILAGLGMTYFQQLMPGRFGAATTLFSNTINVGGMLSGVVSGAWAQAFGYRGVYLLCGTLTLIAWATMQAITRRPGAGKLG